MFEFIRDFEGEIPGATAINCGNYSDMNLDLAKFYAKRFLEEVLYKIDDEHLNYPV
jgi:S-ribosylhomocysteine lyase